jgi:hypothetical protein
MPRLEDGLHAHRFIRADSYGTLSSQQTTFPLSASRLQPGREGAGACSRRSSRLMHAEMCTCQLSALPRLPAFYYLAGRRCWMHAGGLPQTTMLTSWTSFLPLSGGQSRVVNAGLGRIAELALGRLAEL